MKRKAIVVSMKSAVIGFVSLALVSCGGGSKDKGGDGDGDGDGGQADANLMEIKPNFPKPMFEGTPVKATLPNLEKPGKPRLSFKAPEGTKLLSEGKEVTSSEKLPIIGELSYVTDGDLAGGEASFVELDYGPQWVQIDLGAEAKIYNVLVWHFHSAARAYKDVVVQISNDEKFEEGVTTVWNSDDDDSLGFGKGEDPTYVETNHGRIFDVDGVEGRYVRLHSAGNTENDSNHYVEVQVYGIAPEGEKPDTDTPDTDTPDTDTPDTDTPDTDTPDTDTPDTDTPDTDTPDTDTPDTDTPDTDTPDTDTPDTDTPDTDTPDTDAPDTDTPDTDTPDTDAPDTDTPDTDTPDTDAPDTDAPATDGPDTDAPDADAPATDAPDTDAPDTDAPDAPDADTTE